MNTKPYIWMAIVPLALILSACVTILPRPHSIRTPLPGRIDPDDPWVDITSDDLITSFAPTKGRGATYHVGEPIFFWISTLRSGYVTLTGIDPTGRAYVLARNLPVTGGHFNFIPGAHKLFLAKPPLGFHRVRALYHDGVTNVARVTYRGIFGEGSWRLTIMNDIGHFLYKDVFETSLRVRY